MSNTVGDLQGSEKSDSQITTLRTQDWAGETSLKSRGWTNVLRKGE
jgi:hypothetical protein